MKMTAEEKKEFVRNNIGLVKKVVSKIYFKLPKDSSIEFDELVNTGIIGLIKAVEKYDKEKASFSTYAYIKIRGEVLDYLRSLHIVPRTMREKIKKEKEEGKDIPLSNLAIMISMEKAIGDEDGSVRLIDTLVSSEESPEKSAIDAQMGELLKRYIETELNEKERYVLQMYYFEEQNPKEIALKLGISQSRVSQLKSVAVKKLRNAIKGIEVS